MPVKIAVLAQKGGVGKSSLVRSLGCAYTAAGWETLIADMDTGQSTVQMWLQTRLQMGIEPAIAVQSFAQVSQVLKIADHYDALIFDGAGYASKVTADIAKASDLIIIPTGFSTDDMRPAAALANELVDRQKIPAERIAFAFCRTGDSPAEHVESRHYLNQTGYHVLSGAIPEKGIYRRAHDEGLSMIEARHKGLREKADALITSISARVAELTQ